ncbi:MAG TPA: 3-isopropylmalate dehydratase small subunit [Bacteroidaceae bacterium]|nr:3-isopropylmalate dehydratase small subunit [Bacteroidaceae bacterium]
MKPINIIKSTAVPVPIENIDTDQIIPARFLKATSKQGFGDNLFRDWRFRNDKKDPEFPLNNPSFKGKILIAGRNFGCGSSREHAAWALKGYGFDVVVSSFFADIFKNNALNNGLLPITVSPDFLHYLIDLVISDPETIIEVNLKNQTIREFIKGNQEYFDINPYKKDCLLKGFDDIAYLISIKPEIKSWEALNNK